MPGPSSVMDGRDIILSRRPFAKKHHQLYSALPLIWWNMPPLSRNSVLQQSLRLVCLYGFTGYVLSRSFCQRHIMLHLLFDFLIYYDIIQGCCLQLSGYNTFFIPFYRYAKGNAHENFFYLHGYWQESLLWICISVRICSHHKHISYTLNVSFTFQKYILIL